MESKMHSVLFVINSFARGGAERAFLTDIQILENEGYNVSVATLYTKGVLAENLALTRGIVYELNALSVWSAFWRLRALLKGGNYQIVISTLNDANTMARIASLFLPVRLITREANMACAKGWKHTVADILFGFRSNDILAVSHAVKESIVSRAPWLAHNMRVIYNGVAMPDAFTRNRGDGKRLLSVGSLTKKKDHKILIQALSILPSSITLTIVGEGDERKELENLIENNSLHTRVTILGALSHEKVMEVYREHDIFVLPSQYEGCPNVISEAQSMGLPCISFLIPGITEFISSESGIVVSERSPHALAEAIMALVSDASRRERMGQTGFKEVGQTRSLFVHAHQILSLLSKT